jgi:hypothetical protein
MHAFDYQKVKTTNKNIYNFSYDSVYEDPLLLNGKLDVMKPEHILMKFYGK